MLIETISGPFASALLVNHGPVPFDTVLPFATDPKQTGASQATADYDGVVTWVLGGSVALVPNRVFLVPYAMGQKGEQFSMRLWGIRRLGADADPEKTVWVNTLLAEYLCTLGSIPGPTMNPPSYTSKKNLQPTENLCDTITLTHGALGMSGVVVSPGTDATPGSDLTAWVLQENFGHERIYFDFQPEAGFQGTMNCAWARA